MAQDKNKEPKYPWTEEEKIDFASEIKKLEVWKNVQSRIQEQYNKEQRQEISSSLLIGIINRDEEKYNKFQKIVGKEIFHTLLKVQEEYQRLNNAIKRILEDKEDEKEKQETLNSMSLGRSDFCEILCNRYKILDTSELSHEEAFKKFAEWVEMYLQKNHPNKKSINKKRHCMWRATEP